VGVGVDCAGARVLTNRSRWLSVSSGVNRSLLWITTFDPSADTAPSVGCPLASENSSGTVASNAPLPVPGVPLSRVVVAPSRA
jgi:hypothetical protein